MTSRIGAGTVALALLAGPVAAGPLTDGLARSGTYAELSAAFDARLLERHPLGSAVDALEAALVAEGFEAEGEGEDEGEGGARREGWGIVCRPVWLVRWEAAAGRLVALEGERNAICL